MGQRVRCKVCGTVIESLHRHDFRSCNCGQISIDGGDDYCRLLWHDPEGLGNEAYMEYTDDPMAPEDYLWGTFGKDGKGPYKRVRLGDCDTMHLRMILVTQQNLDPRYRNAINSILEKRAKNED